MISSTLDDVLDKLGNKKIAQERMRNSTQFENNIGKILQSAAAVDSTLNRAEEAKNYSLISLEIEGVLKNDLLSIMYDLLAEIENLFVENETVKRYTQLSGELSSYFDRKWKQSVSMEGKQIVSSLETFGQILSNPVEAAQLKEEISKRLLTLPNSPAEIQSFLAFLKKGREIADKAGDDVEVNTFIGRMLNKEATLSDITPKVLVWIEKHNLKNKMKISFNVN